MKNRVSGNPIIGERILTIARVLDRIPVIVINDITAITLFSNDSFGCAVASASFMIALFGLVVTLTCCKD